MSVALCLTRTVRFVGNGGGKDGARKASPPGLLKANAQLLYGDFLSVHFGCMYAEHVWVCVQVSSWICFRMYIWRKVFGKVACIQYTYVLHLSTQTHSACFFEAWVRTGPVIVSLFYYQDNFFYSASLPSLRSFWKVFSFFFLTKDESGRDYLIQTSCIYVCFKSQDGWTLHFADFLQHERT